MYKISTILPSFLGKYDGCATHRKDKLKRAIDSWLSQTHSDKELIVVSDGCEATNDIIENKYRKYSHIKLIKILKEPIWSGMVRQTGLEFATGDLINYLDSDDYFTASHLENIVFRIFERELDWAYYNDYIKNSPNSTIFRNVLLAEGLAGTSCIAHKRSLDVNWIGCNGYGHDWQFIQRLRKASENFDKINGCGYVVCHINNKIDY